MHRVRGLPFTRASTWQRAASYASLYPAIVWRVLRLPRHDVVVTLTDPPLHLVLGPLFKWVKGGRLIHWAQDVYPEVAEELKVVRKGGVAGRLLRIFSTWALRRHDAIIAVGRCMKDRLIDRGIAAEKIVVIPNWAVGLKDSEPAPVASDKKSFTVLYSGNFGLAHPFEAITDAIKVLAGENAPVRFILAGSGPRLAAVRAELASCHNVEFREPASLELLQTNLASADVHLACMQNELVGLVVPSKVYGALSSGRPCLFLGPAGSEVAQLLTQSGTGIVLEPWQGTALADVLRLWSRRGEEYARVQKSCMEAAVRGDYAMPLSNFISIFEPADRAPGAGGSGWPHA